MITEPKIGIASRQVEDLEAKLAEQRALAEKEEPILRAIAGSMRDLPAVLTVLLDVTEEEAEHLRLITAREVYYGIVGRRQWLAEQAAKASATKTKST